MLRTAVRRLARSASVPTSARRPLVGTLVSSRRQFWGGAFETEFEEAHAKKRRSRLRSFFAALNDLPPLGDAQKELISKALSESSIRADGQSFGTKLELSAAVETARAALATQQTASLCLELPSDDGDKPGSAGSAASPEEQSMALPHRQPDAATSASAAMAAAQPQTPPPVVDDDDDKPPDVFTEEQVATLLSLRASYALAELPDLWDKLPLEDLRLPVQSALDAADALCDGSPWRRLHFHLELQRGISNDPEAVFNASDVSKEELCDAAVRIAHNTVPLTVELLKRSTMLSEQEEERLDKMPSDAHGSTTPLVLTTELRRRTYLQRAYHKVRGDFAVNAADGYAPTLAEIGETYRADAALFAALSSEASLHQSLMRSLFSYHDRLATRRRRGRNAVKGTLLFFSLNILDFTITNL